jgi:hypothetical protein
MNCTRPYAGVESLIDRSAAGLYDTALQRTNHCSEEKMACKWSSVCPLRRFERQGQLTDHWAREYCTSVSNWRHCRRYQMEEQGTSHPDNMLPDGSIDEDLR